MDTGRAASYNLPMLSFTWNMPDISEAHSTYWLSECVVLELVRHFNLILSQIDLHQTSLRRSFMVEATENERV